jgi:hypothetical protein
MAGASWIVEGKWFQRNFWTRAARLTPLERCPDELPVAEALQMVVIAGRSMDQRDNVPMQI